MGSIFLFIIILGVLTVLVVGVVKPNQYTKGCLLCGKEEVCPKCGKCYNRDCNNGCAYCRAELKEEYEE